MPTDAELVEAARAGDDQALAAIYDRYATPIHDFCTSVLRDRHEAADAMQDTFVAAAGRIAQLRDPTKLRSWLFAIARHEALRRARRRDRAQPVADIGDTVTASGGTPEDEVTERADGAAAVALVWDAAAGLSERDRALLDLHLRQGLDGSALADAIGAAPDHTYVLMSRLRDQVERSIGALLVARQGRDDCAELRVVLADWDGTFSPLWRKRVARHVEECAVCERTKRGVLGIFGAAPVLAAPATLREPIVAAMTKARTEGVPRERGWQADGFPPPLDPPARGRRIAAIAAAGLLVLGGTAVVLTEAGGDGGRGGGAGDGERRVEAPVRERTTGSTAPVTVAAPSVATTEPSNPSEPSGPQVDEPAVTPTAPTAVPAPGPPPDTTGPTIVGMSASPGVIRWTQCAPPHASTVSATITDDSGVASVTATVASVFGSGAQGLSGGPAYFVVVGPYATNPQAVVPVTVTFTATDGAGNSSQASVVVTWQMAC